MKQLHRKFYILFIFFFLISSCQVNETLVMLKDQISEEFMNKQEEKIITPKVKKETKIEKKNKSEKKIKDDKYEKKNLITENQKLQDEQLVLVQPRVQSKKIEKFKKKRKLSTIGLLVPVTGKRSYAGNYVINSLRLALIESEYNFNFQVLDTKSNLTGLSSAFNKGIKSGVEIFIGPIFSDSTQFLKTQKIDKNILVFSLSSDQDASSDEIIISGTNPIDEIKCIFENINIRNLKNIAVIQTKNKFLEKYLPTFKKFADNKRIDFFNINDEDDLENKIKSLSDYEERKKILKNKIDEIDFLDIDEQEKENLRRSLETKETFGSPPYDAIIISEMGTRAIEIVSLMAYYDLNAENSFIVGTTAWDTLDIRKENVFNGTYFVSNKNSESVNYDDKYFKMFSKRPNKINYISNDLFILLEKIFEYESEKNLEVISFDGTLGNTSLGDEMITREILFKKFINGSTQTESFCSL